MVALLIMASLGAWLLLEPVSACIATLVLVGALFTMKSSYFLMTHLFHYNEQDAVNFDDILTRINDLGQARSSSGSECLASYSEKQGQKIMNTQTSSFVAASPFSQE